MAGAGRGVYIRKKHWLLLGLLVLAGCQSSGWRKPETEPFRLAFWYWSSPLQFQPDEVTQLKALNTARIMVRAFTVSYDGEKVVPILGQRFVESKGAPPILLVANLDAGMVRHFREANGEDLLRTVAEEFSARQKMAVAAGYRVLGWQLDFDVPTSQLGKYSALLKSIRPICKGELSISGLQTWMTSSSLAQVLEPLDAWYPQFYEGELPDTPEDRQTLSNLTAKASRMNEYGKPFWVGIGAYGSTLAFDPTGKRQGVVRGIPLPKARDRFGLGKGWISPSGEQGALIPVNQGPRAGWNLRYSVPTLESLRHDLDLARKTGAMGAALFRYPANGDPTAVPLPTISAAWNKSDAVVKLVVTETSDRQPVFDYIEQPATVRDGTKSATSRLALKVSNTGNIDSGPVGVELEGARFSDILNGGDFPQKIGPGDFSTAGIAPGKSATFGPIFFRDNAMRKIWVTYLDAKGKPEIVEVK
jgi:hypothetical protein